MVCANVFEWLSSFNRRQFVVFQSIGHGPKHNLKWWPPLDGRNVLLLAK